MAAREYIPVRLQPEAIEAVRLIALAEHSGNRSAALRQLLRLGLAAYRKGAR